MIFNKYYYMSKGILSQIALSFHHTKLLCYIHHFVQKMHLLIYVLTSIESFTPNYDIWNLTKLTFKKYFKKIKLTYDIVSFPYVFQIKFY
jgi:hypothetical protein